MLMALAACAWVSPSDFEDRLDYDRDGTDRAADCDDNDPLTHPGAEELCDGLDQDCDGVVDEGESSDGFPHFADADGDGFGDAAHSSLRCQQEAGWVTDDSLAAGHTSTNGAQGAIYVLVGPL